MSVTLADIHTLVRDALKRGTALDTVIPARVRMASRWIERNYTFQYMKRFGEIAVDSGATYPYVIDAPVNFKAIKLLRYRNSDGEYAPIGRIEPVSELDRAAGGASGYWLDGTSRIILNQTPDEDATLEILWDEFTNWPTATTSTNWLMQNGEDFLLAQSMINMAAYLRDPRMREVYQVDRDEALRTLMIADDEMQYSNGDNTIQFVPEGGLT